MIRYYSFLFLVLVFIGCENKYAPDQYFQSSAQKDSLTRFLLPYILPRPDNVDLKDRFKDSLKVYYDEQALKDSLYLDRYFVSDNDSLHYFMFIRRDRKSLYQDYRAIGGILKKKAGIIDKVELKFLTPMFRKDTINQKSPVLFNAMIGNEGLERYVGDRNFIDWPSKDVQYNVELNKWELNPKSEWNKVVEGAVQ